MQIFHVATPAGGEDLEYVRRDRGPNPRRIACRAKNVTVGRAPGRAGLSRRLW
jgi:hypothetical protein